MLATRRTLVALALAALTACNAVSAPPALGTSGPIETRAVRPGPSLVLDGEGMRVFETSGRSRLLGSGTERDTAEAAIVAALGPPSGPDTLNDDCGLTIVGWAPGFTVLFDGDVLAGWSAYAAGAPRTAAGLGIGSTRADLDAAYTASVASSTLSTEFAAGGIAGLLDGTEPDAAITNLWAGNACIAR